MRRFPGHRRQLVIADGIQLRQPALLQQAHKAVVPDRVEGMERVRVFGKPSGGIDHPLLAPFAFVRRQLFSAAEQAIAQMGVGLRQLRHRRLVRESARAEDQHPLIEGIEKAAHRLAQQPGALKTRQRCGDAVNKHRQHRHAVQATQQKLQRLGEAMVHLHVVRHRQVDTAVEDGVGAGFRQLGGHRQVAGGAGEVANRGGADAEAERRHYVIEKTVVVIGGEEHHQLGIEFSNPPPGVGNHPVHFIEDRLLRVYESHQRGVGETVQIGMHIRPPSLQRGRYPRLRGPFFPPERSAARRGFAGWRERRQSGPV